MSGDKPATRVPNPLPSRRNDAHQANPVGDSTDPSDVSRMPLTHDVLGDLLVGRTSDPGGAKRLAGAFHGLADILAAHRRWAPSPTPDVPQPQILDRLVDLLV